MKTQRISAPKRKSISTAKIKVKIEIICCIRSIKDKEVRIIEKKIANIKIFGKSKIKVIIKKKARRRKERIITAKIKIKLSFEKTEYVKIQSVS